MPAFKTVLLLVLLPAAASLHAQDPAGPQGAAPPAAATPPGAYGDAELSSYFASGKLKKAADALQAGQAAQALKLLPKHPEDPPAQWLRAFVLRAANQPRAARAAFEELAAGGGPLGDRALHLAALCAIDGGEVAAADRLLAQVPPRYVDADQAVLERARQLQKAHRPGARLAAQVEEALEPIFMGKVRADVATAHLLAGDAQLAAGAKEKARAHWRAAWLDHPLSPAADSARARERQLGPGEPIPPLKLIRRAEILLDAHRNREALDQLARIKLPPLCRGGCPGDRTPATLLKEALSLLAPGGLPVEHQPTAEDVARIPPDPADPLSCRAGYDRGRALRKERDYGRARAALAPVILRCADPDLRARALYLLAQLQTLAQDAAVASLWEALHRNFPSSSLSDDAVFAQSLARRRAGDFAGERVLLHDVLEHHPESDLRTEAEFRLFWSYFAEGHPRQGVIFLDELAAHPDPDGGDEERARYWRARALLDPDGAEGEAARAASLEAARADLIWLVEQRPLTYHGLLARGRLAQLDPERLRTIEEEETPRVAAMLRTRPPLRAGPLARDAHLLAAIELLRLGLKPEAARELVAVDRSPARGTGPEGEEAMVLLADLFARAGDLRNAHALIRTDLRALLRRTSETLALRAAALAYPLAFREQIAKAAQQARVPADLVQALMREESALDPGALSSAGALGLTQLMPATARDVAQRLRLRGYTSGQLNDPEVNIRLGASYLGQLYRKFHHPALALASYNAGPGTVAGWMKARGGLPLDAFVEEIPLDETRAYVKRCLRSFSAYQYLYGPGTSRSPELSQELSTPPRPQQGKLITDTTVSGG
jgi:soluble lytic murein transglycosylase